MVEKFFVELRFFYLVDDTYIFDVETCIKTKNIIKYKDNTKKN